MLRNTNLNDTFPMCPWANYQTSVGIPQLSAEGSKESTCSWGCSPWDALQSVLEKAAFGSMLAVTDAYPRDNQCEATRGSQWLKSTG